MSWRTRKALSLVRGSPVTLAYLTYSLLGFAPKGPYPTLVSPPCPFRPFLWTMPAFDIVVVGSGGGLDETNLSGYVHQSCCLFLGSTSVLTRPPSRPRRYLVKPCNKSWDDGIVALEAGTLTFPCTTRVHTCANRDSRVRAWCAQTYHEAGPRYFWSRPCEREFRSVEKGDAVYRVLERQVSVSFFRCVVSSLCSPSLSLSPNQKKNQTTPKPGASSSRTHI